jgi:hypothetical protein
MNIGPTVMVDLTGYARTTNGKTLFEARKTLDFFLTSSAPKPHPNDIMDISLWRQENLAGEGGRIVETYQRFCYVRPHSV